MFNMNNYRALSVALVVFVALAYVPIPAQAATSDIGAGMSQKFGRGVTNLLTGFIEVPAQTIKGAKNGVKGIETPQISHPLGTVVGVARGVHQGTGRTLSGAQETVGFWAADYDSNEGYGIPLDAKYAWEEGTQFHMIEPNIGEGMAPIGKKLVRGAGTALFSWMEFPGQIVHDSRKGNPGLGVVEGTYFSLSRLYGGVTDTALFALPNPKDTVGNDYEQDYPWDALMDKEKTEMQEAPAQEEAVR